MPPSGFNKEATSAAIKFIEECYGDLRQEVKDGKHPNFKFALSREVTNIESALSKPIRDKNLGRSTIEFALRFVEACYKELDTKATVHTTEERFARLCRNQLSKLDKDLRELHINKNAEIVRRKQT